MNQSRIDALIQGLKDYSHQVDKMKVANYSLSSVRLFKKYYNALHLELISYIQYKKDIQISTIAKKIKSSKEIFKETDRWIGLLGLSIVFLGIFLIYLYSINVSNSLMIAATSFVVAIVFLLMRKVQKQPYHINNILGTNGETCHEITQWILKNN